MSRRPVADAAPSEPSSLGRSATVLSVAMIIANIGNYVLNLFLGRVLSPSAFSDANLMVTLMLTLTSIALCLQLVAARFVATAVDPSSAAAVARLLRRWALLLGCACAALLCAPAVLWADLFRTSSPVPFVVLGMPFYLLQAVGRGVLQGRLDFSRLAVTFLVEMVVRVGLGIGLVAVGAGVVGATAALSASFVATWLVVALLSRPAEAAPAAVAPSSEVGRYAAFVSVLLIAQIIANNGDVLIGKTSLDPFAAGIYAAVALVGRAVFFLSWSVATVVFPLVAQRQARGESGGGIVRGSLIAVVGIGFGCALGALLLGDPVLTLVLGPDYGGLGVPLAAYAVATTFFAAANLLASTSLSRGSLGDSWILLGGAVLQTAVLLVFHADMAQLIASQMFAMLVTVVVMASAALARVHHSRRVIA